MKTYMSHAWDPFGPQNVLDMNYIGILDKRKRFYIPLAVFIY